MPSAEQLKLLFGQFPLPLAIAVVLFAVAWIAVRKSERLFDPETGTGHLDIWALALAYTVGQHAIDGLSGFPPKDALDWLPFGLLAIAMIATTGACLRLPPAISLALIAAIALGALALTLHGFKLYRTAYPLSNRLTVFAALGLAMLASAAALAAIARRLTLFDFLVLTGVVGTIGAGVLFNAYNTAKIAQILGLALAVGGAGFVIAWFTKARHLSPAFAAGWALLWTVLLSNAYLANYQLPPVLSLCLLLVFPTFAALGLLFVPAESRPVLTRLAVALPALAAALLALALSKPLGEEEEDDDPYAEWGG